MRYLFEKVDRSGVTNCLKIIIRSIIKYFENSRCQDYVTEKFFRGLGEFVVPVVLGGADYSTVAPAKSYISVQNFTSPRQLAEYLDWLVSNPAEYLSYFWWKPHYRVVEDVDPKTPHALPASFPCKLCVGSIAKDNKFVSKRRGTSPH